MYLLTTPIPPKLVVPHLPSSLDTDIEVLGEEGGGVVREQDAWGERARAALTPHKNTDELYAPRIQPVGPFATGGKRRHNRLLLLRLVVCLCPEQPATPP